MSSASIDQGRRSFLLPGQGKPRVANVAMVGPACLAEQGVECRLCGEGCDAGAIRFPPRRGGVAAPVIDGTRCTACGDCLALCPSGALKLG